MALSAAALRTRLENEWVNIIEPMNRPGFVEITHSPTFDRFSVTVYGTSYVVSEKPGGTPLERNVHKFTVYPGSNYPAQKPRVAFDDPKKRIAHINVWDTGTICISDWSPKMCNIGTTISKCIHAIAFDPGNWRKDSMACSANLAFIEEMEAKRAFPTFDLKKIPIPGQKAAQAEPLHKRTFRRLA